MRVSFTSALVALALLTSASASPSGNGGGGGRGPKPPRVCDYNAKGPGLQAKQQAALADFADLYAVQHDIQTAFDRYVPGQYIQHNPIAPQGREFAIEFLSNSFATPGTSTSNVRHFAGEGFGAVHMKLVLPTITFAAIDYFRFEGTCIVEHWDVLQEITGNEPNPIAFF